MTDLPAPSPPGASVPPASAAAVRLERIALIHAQGYVLARGSFLATVVTALFVYTQVDRRTLAVWLLVNLVLLGVREWNLRDYHRRPRDERQRRATAYAARFTTLSVINGLLWGLVPTLFARDDTITLALVFAIHGGYTAAAAISSVLWWPSFLAFVLPSSALFIGATLHFHFDALWSLAIAIALFTVLVLLLGRRNLASLTDQIELRLANQELLTEARAQRDRAEAAVKARSRFLAAASHDLRQPVHALTLFTHALEPHLQTAQARQILSKMRQSTDALGGLFHGLLDLSQLDADAIECEPRHVRLGSLFAMLDDEFHAEAARRDLTFTLQHDDDRAAFVDLALLEPVLRNLLSNALKYTSTGRITLSVDDARTDRLCIEVHDTGRGIPEAEFDNIFSEYHQLENPERDRRKGLGLGLAIVRRLCDLMGAELELRSVVGEGSTFRICLPVGDPDAVRPDAPPAESHRDLVALSVLVIDDEPDILEGMGRVLDGWGCHATLASSLADALAETDAPPHLIIADYRLREHATGIDAVRRLRDTYGEGIPALLITGDTDSARLRGIEIERLDVLHKPIDPTALRRAMESCLDALADDARSAPAMAC